MQHWHEMGLHAGAAFWCDSSLQASVHAFAVFTRLSHMSARSGSTPTALADLTVHLGPDATRQCVSCSCRPCACASAVLAEEAMASLADPPQVRRGCRPHQGSGRQCIAVQEVSPSPVTD